jgi:uncharacterized membrane protein YagU involved in acid resistance
MKILLRVLVGALGGLSATGPVTIAMILLHRRLPIRHRYSLPPREITVHLAEKAGVHRKLGPEARAALTLINHFGYGAMAATTYSLAERQIPTGVLVKGPLFGALVWLVSYFGLLPAVGILDPATKHPLSRNVLMLAVHLVWGLVVGVFVETLLSEKRSVFGALVASSPLRQEDRQ